MPAHDGSGEGPAHDSTPAPGHKPKRVQVDASGISMDWRVAAVLLAILTGSSGITVAKLLDQFGVATIEDMGKHDGDKKSHRVPGTDKGVVEVVLDQDAAQRVLVGKVDGIEQKISAIDEKVGDQGRVLYDFRAEDVAEKASERIRDPRESREVMNRVRERVRRNLESGKPARDGLEDYLGGR